MRWYDRLMVGALAAVLAVLVFLGVRLVATVEAETARLQPVTIDVTTDTTRPCPLRFADEWRPRIEECP